MRMLNPFMSRQVDDSLPFERAPFKSLAQESRHMDGGGLAKRLFEGWYSFQWLQSRQREGLRARQTQARNHNLKNDSLFTTYEDLTADHLKNYASKGPNVNTETVLAAEEIF